MYHQEVELAPLPEKWRLPKAWGEWALSVRNDWTELHVRALAKRFADYHNDGKVQKADWEIVWRAWVRNQKTELLKVKEKNPWWECASGIEEKGVELGVTKNEGEPFPYYKLRVFAAAGSGPWSKPKNEGISNV